MEEQSTGEGVVSPGPAMEILPGVGISPLCQVIYIEKRKKIHENIGE